MVGRITVGAIGAAGVVVAGLSVASATLWRPDDVLRASVTTDSPYVVTAAGVVEMGGEPTTVTVKTVDGKKAPLVIAVGRDTDVVGWVGDDPHETVSGMSGWSTLRIGDGDPTATATAEPTGQPAEDEPAQDPAQDEAPAQDETPVEYQSPAGSDMWLAEASGEGRAELKEWAPDSQYPGRWSVLVANPTEATATIELAWPREVSTPWLIPGLIVGLGAIGWVAYVELRRRGVLTFRRKAGADDDAGKDSDTGESSDSPPPPRSRREVRAAQASGRSGPVPVVEPTTDVPDEPAVEDWGTAAFGAHDDATAASGTPDDVTTDAPDAVPDPVQAPARGGRFERALPAWSPARTWQRARHSTEPDVAETDVAETPTRSRPTEATPVVAPAPIQPPPASPGRPRTPAWSRTTTPPTTTPPTTAPPTTPAPAAPTARLAPSPSPSPSPAPAPSATAPASGRRRAWPPAPQSAAPRPEAGRPEVGPPAVETSQTRRSGPFGRGARPEPGSSSAPTLGASPSRSAPPSGWVPGRGGRTGAVPQVPAPTEQTGGARRPAWLGRTRASATGPVPTALQATPPPGTAPRLSAGPQPAGPQPAGSQSAGEQLDPPRGDAWRQIWGISTDDGSQEDR